MHTMSILLVGSVLSFAWASAVAMPAINYTEMGVISKAMLQGANSNNQSALKFLSGMLYGYSMCMGSQTEPTEPTGKRIGTYSSDAERYKPIFIYDDQAHKNCFPDAATSSNNGQCRSTLDQKTPIYYQTTSCNGTTVYTYWHWYGWQNNCSCGRDSVVHDNDWEHISVYVKNNQAHQVVFHQYAGHYTRRRGRFPRSGERPVVYVGRYAHGSYHMKCDDSLWWPPRDRKNPSLKYHPKYCQGSCGYWDDFRKPGPTWDGGTLTDLKPGQTIDGIKRPDRKICTSDIKTCVGARIRVKWTSGCWQNYP